MFWFLVFYLDDYLGVKLLYLFSSFSPPRATFHIKPMAWPKSSAHVVLGHPILADVSLAEDLVLEEKREGIERHLSMKIGKTQPTKREMR